MQRNYYQWPIERSPYRLSLVCSLGISLLLTPLTCLAFSHPGSTSDQRADIIEILSLRVERYDNNGRPLISTLLDVASRHHVPMGIEKVTPEALRAPLQIVLQSGTIRDLLTVCVRQLPDYHWAVHDGVVDIYGEKEWGDRLNLLNYVVASLEVKGGDLNLINARLRMLMPERLPVPHPVLGSEGVGGSFGDTPGVGGLESTHNNVEARNATVRSILNRIVALSHGKVIWISRVPPNELWRAPSQGLWLLTSPSTGGIIPYLDPSLSR